MRRFITLFMFTFMIAGMAMNVTAQTDAAGIQSLLEERDAEIKEILGPEGSEYSDEQRETLKTIINGIIDFEAMSKTALDDTYEEISEESRKEFVDLFSTIIRDNSLTKLDIYRAEVSYNEIEIEGEDALVQTMAELDDVRTPVNYKMKWKDGEWVIIDMSIDDVYTAESYHRQFQRIIARRGFDALMESLRKRAARA
ncbi:MAG: ABC transporter substrate-binding protein [Balneolaceae bacterium]|nr:ABC transporter substrate-binding protein [Balneolaceae bacterium]